MTTFKKISAEDIAFFEQILGKDYVHTDIDQLDRCASDQTEDLKFTPELVIQPINEQEISKVLAYCNQERIPVTPRGAGTGLSGGALAVRGGLVLDMKRMNRILFLDTDNFQVTVEPGIITEVLQNTVAAQGMYYPPDPASRGSCFIGGNIAENSGGPRAVKYGVVKDYVLNLEVVLPNGEIIWTGANVLKNATGYNLSQLFVGSEGTLAVITKIVLRLIPAVKHNLLLLVPFRKAEEACIAVNKICMAGITPSALEFMERAAIACALDYCNTAVVKLPEDIEAHLLIEVDGNHKEQLYQDVEEIASVLDQFDIDEVLFADSEAQKKELWQLRRVVGEAVKGNSIYKEEDTVVPRSYLPQLLKKVKEVGAAYGFQSICYGHAGDGNLHVNIIKGDMSELDWQQKLPLGIREIFAFVVGVNGTISGEHGIGWVQKNYIDIAFSNSQQAWMQSIKQLFDPNGILNPDKIFKNG